MRDRQGCVYKKVTVMDDHKIKVERGGMWGNKGGRECEKVVGSVYCRYLRISKKCRHFRVIELEG